jgi:hypothetical protein
MPKPELMYRIADARGISGGDNSKIDTIIEEVDINPMLCRPLDAPSTMKKMVVGKKCMKFSTVLEEDGTLRRSSACTSVYNVWERCLELWSKEELETNGYENVKTGRYEYFKKDHYGDYYVKGQYSYPVKYNTQFKRKAHFDAEMKFAAAKAETKAYLKTIRELAGLMTGYKREDLVKGYLVFAKIRRSKSVLKLETAARIDAIRHGIEPGRQAAALLFGADQPKQIAEEPEPVVIGEPVSESVFTFQPFSPPPPQKKSPGEELKAVLTVYRDGFLIPPELSTPVDNLVGWLESEAAPEKNAGYWKKALGILDQIESQIPEEARIIHELKEVQ